MRRALTLCTLVLVALSGLWLLLRAVEPPPGAWTDREVAADPTDPGEPGEPPPPAPVPLGAPTPLTGLLWTEGGCRVCGVEVRLETDAGEVLSRAVSDADGRFSVLPVAAGRAGTGLRLHVNPAPAATGYGTARPTAKPRSDQGEIYLHRVRSSESLDVTFEIRGAVSTAQGGDTVRIILQDETGECHGHGIDPEVTSAVIEGVTPGRYAITAVQGDLSASVAPRVLDPAGFPILLVLERAAVLVGNVVRPDGQPASGAEVRLTYDATPDRILRGQYVYVMAKSTDGYPTFTATTDEEGAFRVEGLPAARLALSIRHPSGTLRREVVVPAAGDVVELRDLVLGAATGRLRVSIDLPGGVPTGEGRLLVTAIGHHHRVSREAECASVPGSIVIEDLPPDVYGVALVQARSIAGGRGRFEGFVSLVGTGRVTAGETCDVVLEPLPR